MYGLGAQQSAVNIGAEAEPPFAVLPDPSTLFLNRSKRLRELAPGHILEAYLNFAADVTAAQHEIQAGLPEAALPAPKDISLALSLGIAPLSRSALEPGEAGEVAVMRLLGRLGAANVPAETGAAIASLAAVSSETLRQLMGAALADTPAENIAERVLILAGLQVHFTRLAAQLGGVDLQPADDGFCPVCGSAPMTSSVVGWPNAHNTRFCTCSLCATMWHVVRIKCVLCSSTEGIGYRLIEGGPEAVKAETCDNCGRYVKILYQVKDPALDSFADDIASLALDLLLAGEGWDRGGQNPFLLGY
jgi:FdhE protein